MSLSVCRKLTLRIASSLTTNVRINIASCKNVSHFSAQHRIGCATLSSPVPRLPRVRNALAFSTTPVVSTGVSPTRSKKSFAPESWYTGRKWRCPSRQRLPIRVVKRQSGAGGGQRAVPYRRIDPKSQKGLRRVHHHIKSIQICPTGSNNNINRKTNSDPMLSVC